jgi:hypothetical protein
VGREYVERLVEEENTGQNLERWLGYDSMVGDDFRKRCSTGLDVEEDIEYGCSGIED